MVLVVVLVALLAVARVPVRAYLKLIAGPLLFMAMSILPLLFTLSFHPLHLGVLPDGVQLALRVSLRALAGVNCLFFLILTTPIPQILGVMHRCRVPAVVTEISVLVYRHAWVFVSTVGGIRRAQEARLGYTSYGRSYRSLAMLTGALFGQALQRGRALERGLDARNWQGEFRVLDDAPAASAATVTFIVLLEVAVLGVTVAWLSL
ncbi:MAG: cobalt ECF transporter T component CbiQ [Actinobacteria bacterium]|nr:cobalt ECF transporter T component CbiQ [Actinomycetota bacterium]